jgi:hypothetical protein
MVDYCIHVCPDLDSQARIDQLYASRPGATINHTDWGNLCRHPIALSIETKRVGEGFDNAMAQVGKWHSAQWRSLLYDGRRELSGITFLPALIVQGHTWSFVATTREHGQAAVHARLELGSSESLVGVYQILVALQCLKRWAEDEYWPALKAYLIGQPQPWTRRGRQCILHLPRPAEICRHRAITAARRPRWGWRRRRGWEVATAAVAHRARLTRPPRHSLTLPAVLEHAHTLSAWAYACGLALPRRRDRAHSSSTPGFGCNTSSNAYIPTGCVATAQARTTG